MHNSGLGRLWIKLLFCSDTSLHESCFQIGARGDNRILPPTDSHRQLLSAFCTSRKPHISFKLFFNTHLLRNKQWIRPWDYKGEQDGPCLRSSQSDGGLDTYTKGYGIEPEV